MIFNSKQLEELESIHDSTGAFEEEGDDEAGFDEVGEAAMDWRRGLIEEAAENIKRAKTRPVEPHIQYNIGSMLFDREEKRFARVQRSVPGYLKIVYLSGGDREYGTLDVVEHLKDQGATKRLSELAQQLGLPDVEVLHELERLGITPLDEPEVAEPAPEAGALGERSATTGRAERPAAAVLAERSAAAVIERSVRVPPPPFARIPPNALPGAHRGAPLRERDDDDDDDEDGTRAEAARPVGGKAPHKPALAAKPTTRLPLPARGGPPSALGAKLSTGPAAAGKGHHKPLNGTPAVAKGASGKSVNPIDDPNGYIKAHFQAMSNRELARLTGLSEHTIRRKLGEWSLKRKRD